MGLDMYLTKDRYLWTEERAELKIDFPVQPNNSTPVASRITNLIEEVGYWRKANAIHHWFVQNVQHGQDDCEKYLVDQEDLKELLALVEQVLSDRTLAETLLPVKGGFFFGSLEYDEWYFRNLEDTQKILHTVLSENSMDDLYYQASW